MSQPPVDDHRNQVWRYYDRTESRLGYTLLLHGVKHYGWYEPGTSMWRFQEAMRRMEDELAARLTLPAGARVLDAGCGTGAVALSLASRHGLKVTGIDILDWNLKKAIAKAAGSGLAEATTFTWGDYHNLEFADESFDGVYTMETLVHALEPDQALAEFHRVLKPGGHAVLVEYSHPPMRELPAPAYAALERVCELAAMPAWLEFEDGVLDAKLAKLGFTDIVTENVTPRMLPMLRAFARLGRFPYFVGRRLGKVEKTVNAMSGVEMYRHQSAWSYNITTATKPAG